MSGIIIFISLIHIFLLFAFQSLRDFMHCSQVMEQLWLLVSFQKSSDNTVKIINLDCFLECSIDDPWKLTLILIFMECTWNFKIVNELRNVPVFVRATVLNCPDQHLYILDCTPRILLLLWICSCTFSMWSLILIFSEKLLWNNLQLRQQLCFYYATNIWREHQVKIVAGTLVNLTSLKVRIWVGFSCSSATCAA